MEAHPTRGPGSLYSVPAYAGTFTRILRFLEKYLPTANRLCKYTVLLLLILVNLIAVVECYSFYIARRDINDELRRKNVSIGYLNVLDRRERVGAHDVRDAVP